MYYRPLWSALLLALTLLMLTSLQAATTAVDEPPPPPVNAEKVVVLSDFNEVLYAYGEHDRVGPASLTKMMTALVAMRYGDLSMTVTVEEHDLIGEATMGLVAGDQLTLGDVLYGLLMPSGNDAALAIARTVGWQPGDQTPEQSVGHFVDLMNQTAAGMGLRDSHFMNPHGLDQWGHYSSAYDMALILRAALNYPEIRERMQTLAIRVGVAYDLYNGNELLRSRADYLGGKTGLTDDCGFCLAAAVRPADRMSIAVVMRDDWSWFYDVDLLLDYGLELMDLRGLPAWADPALLGTQLNQPRDRNLPPVTALPGGGVP
jgi:D-alanyl-D-alanine carboxypeptidase (penicillin-binding protein 5/6)